MKVCEYWRSRSFLELGPRSCTYINSNLIFSETAVPIWTKFCMQGFRYKEMKIWWHDAGHMTKIAATPIYGKNPSKIFSRTGLTIFTKLGMKYWELQPIINCSNDYFGVTLTYFTARSNLVTYAFLWKKVKTVDFSETIAACDLKVGRCRQLNKGYEGMWVLKVKVISLPYIIQVLCFTRPRRWASTGPLVLWLSCAFTSYLVWSMQLLSFFM